MHRVDKDGKFMTLAKRIYTEGSMLVSFLIALTVFSQITSRQVISAMKESDDIRDIQAQIAPKIIDHYKWVKALAVKCGRFGVAAKGILTAEDTADEER